MGEMNVPIRAMDAQVVSGRALVVVRTSRQSGPIAGTARTPGLRDGSVMIQVTAVAERPELRLANPQTSELFVSGEEVFRCLVRPPGSRSD